MYLNKSAVLTMTILVQKDDLLIRTEIYTGEASYGSKRRYQPTVWIKMNGILQKQFSGEKGKNEFWQKIYPKLMENCVHQTIH